MQHSRAKHPILGVMDAQGRRHTWLAKTTGYTAPYLSKVFNGHLPTTARLRAACSEALGLPESALFHDSPAPDHTTENAA